jgi:hypothetical protein
LTALVSVSRRKRPFKRESVLPTWGTFRLPTTSPRSAPWSTTSVLTTAS